MSRFLQLHFLTFYPPSNVNRDDTGAPKTATVGGVTRLRISSQALKRAWRTSPVFTKTLEGHMGQRTQRLAEEIFTHLRGKDINEKEATEISREIAKAFGKVKEEKPQKETADDKKEKEDKKAKKEKVVNTLLTEQLVFISPDEFAAAYDMADKMAAGEKIDPVKEKEAALLFKADTAVDIGLFGRMLADTPTRNREAAAQVAHAITTHRVTVEDDYYTAVDDLKTAATDSGAGFIGEAGFGSGVFYLYLCINLDLFKKNLGPQADETLMNKALAALIEAAATVTPSGKQNSFAAHARAGYILAEKGDEQPRTLAGAFAKPVTGGDLMDESVKALGRFREDLSTIYGAGCSKDFEVSVGSKEKKTLKDLIKFCQL
ncbi:type I-E CRISPR-associated protein Cas7/Cse4/CasC [Acetobacteraceae bacterium ESL0709]|nr:type I-E CRISPR-associated protein Cas7/Cse4/CasC [Acetobacteraceae bacterium ESL0697]MDF7677513.1 type I-E CRISPR-associated protein Cas7/Cse4/CasC [Acetobacteraceae bacterium ESL0709]